MQITSMKNRQRRWALAALIMCGYVGVSQARDGVAPSSATAVSPAAYRAMYKDSVVPIKYILVDENGQECCHGPRPKKVYVLDITRDVPVRKMYSPEITDLARAHFEVEVDLETLIETPKADFVVLNLSRPIEYSKNAKPCAVGMGEDRRYLARIDNDAIRFVDRNLLGCGDRLDVLKDKNAPGYEITVNHAGAEKAKLVRYVYRDGKMIKQFSAVRSTDRK